MTVEHRDGVHLPAASIPFLALGSASIVAGGFVAAVSRPTSFEAGPWLAAYLVLVGGVALIGLGVGQSMVARSQPSSTVVAAQLGAWVISTAAVALGSLASMPLVSAIGSVVLVAALGSFFRSAVGSRAGGLVLWAYRVILLVLIISVPVGLVLAWQRHS